MIWYRNTKNENDSILDNYVFSVVGRAFWNHFEKAIRQHFIDWNHLKKPSQYYFNVVWANGDDSGYCLFAIRIVNEQYLELSQ